MSGDFGPSGSGMTNSYVRLAKEEGGRTIARRRRRSRRSLGESRCNGESRSRGIRTERGCSAPKKSRTSTIVGGGRSGRVLGGEEVLKVGWERGFESEGVAFEFEGKSGSVKGLPGEEELCFQ